jgi:hypothetical protein
MKSRIFVRHTEAKSAAKLKIEEVYGEECVVEVAAPTVTSLINLRV